MSKWITIETKGFSPSGLTRIWGVLNTRTHQLCGQIRWHGAFRKYCFYPTDGFLFDSACLTLITLHLETVNAVHKRKA